MAAESLKLLIPNGLLQFALTYGSGFFVGDLTTELQIYNPLDPNYLQSIEFDRRRLLDAKKAAGDEAVPFAIYPEDGGLLPLGRDDSGTKICWKTRVDRSWDVVVLWDWGPNGFQILPVPLMDFLFQLFSRELILGCWPEPWFSDGLKFKPKIEC